MTTFLAIMTFIFGVGLLVVAAVQPRRVKMSQFELHRRAEQGDASAADILRRDRLISDVVSLQRIITSLLLVVITILLVSIFNIVIGILFAVVVAVQYGSIARLEFIRAWAQGMYEQFEPGILEFIQRYPQIMRLLRNVTLETKSDDLLESREQLVHLVSKSDGVLTSDEKKLIAHALEFDNLVVSSIMTPVSMIDSISKDELLGPLVLDDLHKTGHSRFPVIDGDIHHVIGMLYIRDLLSVGNGKNSTTAGKSMQPRVFYIRQDQTLTHALAAFLRTHHHLFVVVNEFRETVGLLSLEDVIEALLGRRIVDEFDAHEDLRVVAARNPRGNNHPAKHTDV